MPSISQCSSGFWQVKLDCASAKLCTFNTPFGRYILTGCHLASHQHKIYYVRNVWRFRRSWSHSRGHSHMGHHRSWAWCQAWESFPVCRATQSEEKSQIKLKEISYIGHILKRNQTRPPKNSCNNRDGNTDEQRRAAITEMATQVNKEELQRF